MPNKTYEANIQQATHIQQAWSRLPAPKRGEVIRVMGQQLRALQPAIAEAIMHEAKKKKRKGRGQKFIGDLTK